MLRWLNGPFGGGETQTAHELLRRLPGSVVCDPEVLDIVLGKHDGPVIVPMTVVEPAYFREIVGRLRECGDDVGHFALLADRETVRRRLRAEHIADPVGLTLTPNTDGPWRGRLRRAVVGVRHIRIG